MPLYPNFQVFQRVTADLLNATTPTVILKATSLPAVVSSTTLVNDGEFLNIPLGIGVWEIQFFLHVTSDATAASTLGQFKSSWLFSGTATGFKNCIGSGPTNNVVTTTDVGVVRMSVHGLATAVSYGTRGTANFNRIEERSVITVTAAGTLTLQYAQVSSSTTATSIQAGSWMTYRQIG